MLVSRTFIAGALIAGLTLSFSAFVGPGSSLATHSRPPSKASPPNQVTVAAVNAQQDPPNINEARMNELADRLRSSITDVDGSAVAPDVIILNEVHNAVMAGLVTAVNRAFEDVFDCTDRIDPCPYQLAGSNFGVRAKFLVNTATVGATEAVRWPDVCLPERTYQLLRMTQTSTGQTFSVAGVHLDKNYEADTTTPECKEQNVDELRRQLAPDLEKAVIIGGDFNRRAMKTQLECDPTESSNPLQWWSRMTSASDIDSRSYTDAVRFWHRSHDMHLLDDWTHEAKSMTTLCTGLSGIRRSRIDYLFVDGARVIEAHADHPGWGGAEPGTPNAELCATHPSCKYSNHRFVWGRFEFLEPNEPPVASFRSRCVYLECTFTDASTDPDGEIASSAWDFGDGSSSTQRNPQHAYAEPGSYDIELTITDDRGARATYTAAVEAIPLKLRASAERDDSKWRIRLTWNDIGRARVLIYRNDRLIDVIGNRGYYIDVVRRRQTYTYKLCIEDNATCSNEATVSP